MKRREILNLFLMILFGFGLIFIINTMMIGDKELSLKSDVDEIRMIMEESDSIVSSVVHEVKLSKEDEINSIHHKYMLEVDSLFNEINYKNRKYNNLMIEKIALEMYEPIPIPEEIVLIDTFTHISYSMLSRVDTIFMDDLKKIDSIDTLENVNGLIDTLENVDTSSVIKYLDYDYIDIKIKKMDESLDFDLELEFDLDTNQND